MRPGLVVSIRLSPTDCQSILDVMEQGGSIGNNQTFSSMVAIVVASLLESARGNGIIPEPDAFRYWDRMGQYHKNARTDQKSNVMERVTNKLNRLDIRRDTPDDVEDSPVQMTPAQKRAGLRLTELIVKQEHASDSWSAGDQAEYDQLYKIVYPDG